MYGATHHVPSEMMTPLNQYIIVLHQPRHVTNIGGVVRVMKNLGLQHLRLVEPVPFDDTDILGIAHRSHDILSTLQTYTSLNETVSDATYVVGTTARRRGQYHICGDVREFARELVSKTPLLLRQRRNSNNKLTQPY